MKTLRLIGMAVIAIIMSANFAACSDDDDKRSNPVIGTWEVIGDDSDEVSNDIGDIYTFYDNGTALHEWSYVSNNTEYKDSHIYNYKLDSDNTILYIDYDDGDGYEDYSIKFTNNLMTWTYTSRDDGKTYTMTLKRIK